MTGILADGVARWVEDCSEQELLVKRKGANQVVRLTAVTEARRWPELVFEPQ